ncbi:MAG: MiaB/RimO family radical SAM methylthiotransferase [Clostridia bacterium]|nr:MiaB/RimO family radical SAM methylthiotransferase [Clostridia bacterium]
MKQILDKKIGVISLGCDKNRVDTEKMLAILSTKHTLTPDVSGADVLIVNTCAFLESARKEAVEEILMAIESKKHGVEKVIVTGCLPQLFVDQIKDELVEVDAFLGVSDYAEILQVIDKIYAGERVITVGEPRGECGTERVLTTNGYAYLKIADGCSNHCTYCLIPSIRGKYRSVEMADLIKEAKSLGALSELILVAQDTAKYGLDLNNGVTLVTLLQNLSKLENVKAIRLLYCYPENITDELIDEIANNKKIIKYIDMPLQHADDKVLKLMNRKGTAEGYLGLIDKLRKKVKGIAIRSTFITGFPRESEDAFNNLTEFLQ